MSYRILVSGRVQGVSFRNMTKRYADQQGLKGTVQNLDDGRVEIVVSCSSKEKNMLVRWLKSNPGFSDVQCVEVQEVKKSGFEGFVILRESGFLKDQCKSFKQLGRRILKL